MNKILGILLIFIVASSCQKAEKDEVETVVKTEFQEIISDDFELSKPAGNTNKVLVLFGGFPETAEDIKREFPLLEEAKENDIVIVYMNYNQKLWLEESEKQQLAERLQSLFLEHQLPTNDIYIGGFSSGGNVSLLISAFLLANNNFTVKPKGVFIVDSPIDLLGLYRSSEKNIQRNFSEVSVQESNWIIGHLEKNVGDPEKKLSEYEKKAVFTSKTNTTTDLASLKDTKIRLYTEPDTLWWRENRMADYDQMNAFYIERLSENLKKAGFSQVEYIPTENKGYRANGERHPHSWSIVDKEELVEWMME